MQWLKRLLAALRQPAQQPVIGYAPQKLPPGIISREPVIFCNQLEVTALTVLVDGQLMGYITNLTRRQDNACQVTRQLPGPDGKFVEVTQTLIQRR